MNSILKAVLGGILLVVLLVLSFSFLQIVLVLLVVGGALYFLRQIPIIGPAIGWLLGGWRKKKQPSNAGSYHSYAPPRSTYIDDFRAEYLSRNPGREKDITRDAEVIVDSKEK